MRSWRSGGGRSRPAGLGRRPLHVAAHRARLEVLVRAAGQHELHRVLPVLVGIGEVAAPDHQRVVEQLARAVGLVAHLELLHDVGELARQPGLELREARETFAGAAAVDEVAVDVARQRERPGDRPSGTVVAVMDAGDAGDVAGEGVHEMSRCMRLFVSGLALSAASPGPCSSPSASRGFASGATVDSSIDCIVELTTDRARAARAAPARADLVLDQAAGGEPSVLQCVDAAARGAMRCRPVLNAVRGDASGPAASRCARTSPCRSSLQHRRCRRPRAGRGSTC